MVVATSVVDEYLAGWRDTDPAAVATAATSFTDPDTSCPAAGSALSEHARTWFTRFPGTFEFTVHGPVATWRFTGVHRAPYLGMPATGTRIEIDGADVLSEEPDGLHVRRHFDRVAVAAALGYDARFVPAADGDREFGLGTRTSGRAGEPGALVVTYLDVRDDAEGAEVDLMSVEVVRSLRASSGFLGAATLDIGTRKYTLSAFDRPESVRAVHARPHQRAMRRFFRGGVSTGGYIGVWTPLRESRYTRCPECGVMTASDVDCGCGPPAAPGPLF